MNQPLQQNLGILFQDNDRMVPKRIQKYQGCLSHHRLTVKGLVGGVGRGEWFQRVGLPTEFSGPG